MDISEELLLNLVEAVKKLMVKNLRMEEYIRSLPRADRAEFSLEDEIPSDAQATHNEKEIQRTFSGIRDTILEGSDPGPKLKQALSRVRALG